MNIDLLIFFGGVTESSEFWVSKRILFLGVCGSGVVFIEWSDDVQKISERGVRGPDIVDADTVLWNTAGLGTLMLDNGLDEI